MVSDSSSFRFSFEYYFELRDGLVFAARFAYRKFPIVAAVQYKLVSLFRLFSVCNLKAFNHAARKLVRRKTIEEKIGVPRIIGMHIMVAMPVPHAHAVNFPRIVAKLGDFPYGFYDFIRIIGARFMRLPQTFGRKEGKVLQIDQTPTGR